jgi:hypothetical protein
MLPRYSIIIPSHLGMPYLDYALQSVLAYPRSDMEVILSIDGVDAHTEALVTKISDIRVKVIRPIERLSMSEHWDFAQTFATGKWQMFLGQDDLLMQGFSELFDYLTNEAEGLGLNVVVARRAYVTWFPVKDRELKSLQYWRSDEFQVRDSLKFVEEALTSAISYHSGPQMYTTTLVSKQLISKIRDAQSGTLILGHPQDSFLAASILKFSDRFLWSGKPFSFVGTSDKSAGLAISNHSLNVDVSKIADSYLRSVSSSKSITYSSKVDFRHGINARYFYDSIKEVWPSALPLSGTNVKIDANIIAGYLDSKVRDLTIKQVCTNNRSLIIKYLMALLIRISRRISSISLEIVVFFTGNFLAKRIFLKTFASVEDNDELFRLAMSVKS